MSDTFRKEYKPLSDHQKLVLAEIKDKAEELLELFDQPHLEIDQRQMALAKTNLEQSIMWAVKSIT